MTNTSRLILSLAVAFVLLGTQPAPLAAEWAFPTRVLITNDNGIEDPKVVALARAFSKVSETWLVAPRDDRSGSGSYLSVTRTGELAVEPRDLGPGIRAFAVDGYPADCVVLALAGLMADSPPDLVVSGINGGANLGGDWMFSGTIGAARVAALAGFPALAVSGLNDDLAGAVDAAVDWVVRLAGSEAVLGLAPLEYVTASLPRTTPEAILGVRITDRAGLRVRPRLQATDEGSWRLVGMDPIEAPPSADSDLAAWNGGYIALVPMRADEVDLDRLARWRRTQAGLPEWQHEVDLSPFSQGR